MRLLPQFLAFVAAGLLAATPAAAQWGREGRGGGRDGGWTARGRDGGYPRADRGAYGGGMESYGRGRGGGYGRGYPGRSGGYDDGRFGGAPGYGAPGYAPPGYGPPPFARPRQALRRGQIAPLGYRDARVPDPGRYHLRSAPNGYDWVGDGRDAYLIQRSTGMVMDSAPGAYEPPRGRGRGRDGRR